ncbi:hypothetical protein HY633_00565 [Candidatus Uhrbacteria bacterium]|nr:hypothetical protein [Candidatus Uhrbacteria bacterium]
MILFLDIATPSARVAVVSSTTVRWSVGGNAYALVERARGAKLDAVIIARPSAEAIKKPTWSGIRSAVAIANALAFATGAKVGEIEISGQEKKSVLEAAVRAAAKKSKKGAWIEPRYSGEPNITTPKPRQ